MNNHKYSSLAVALLLFSSSASVLAATPSLDFTVGGVIAPASCSPTVNSVDLGKITIGQLDKVSFTNKSMKKVTVNVDCNFPTVIIFNMKDNRHSSSVPHIPNGTLVGLAPSWFFGLGLTEGGQSIGSMTMKLGNYKFDGKSVLTVSSETGPNTLHNGSCAGQKRTPQNITEMVKNGITTTVDFAGMEQGSCVPAVATHHSFDLDLFPDIAPNDGRFTIGSTPQVDGNVSISLTYI